MGLIEFFRRRHQDRMDRRARKEIEEREYQARLAEELKKSPQQLADEQRERQLQAARERQRPLESYMGSAPDVILAIKEIDAAIAEFYMPGRSTKLGIIEGIRRFESDNFNFMSASKTGGNAKAYRYRGKVVDVGMVTHRLKREYVVLSLGDGEQRCFWWEADVIEIPLDQKGKSLSYIKPHNINVKKDVERAVGNLGDLSVKLHSLEKGDWVEGLCYWMYECGENETLAEMPIDELRQFLAIPAVLTIRKLPAADSKE